MKIFNLNARLRSVTLTFVFFSLWSIICVSRTSATGPAIASDSAPKTPLRPLSDRQRSPHPVFHEALADRGPSPFLGSKRSIALFRRQSPTSAPVATSMTPNPGTNPSTTGAEGSPAMSQSPLSSTGRVLPYTPVTGANNSLYVTPNVTSKDGLVEIKVGVLLPYSLPNNLTQQLAISGTSAIRMAVSEINANRLIPGAYITLVLKDSFNGLDPDNSGAAQAIFSTVALLQGDGVSGVIGDVSSALTVQSALLTSRLSVPQCSYSASSIQLSSKEDYSYFFRTIPTEPMFGRIMLDFVVNRKWKKVAVFYTGDDLGAQMMDYIAIQAIKRNITIGYRRAFWETGTSSDVGPGLSALKETGIQIVLVAAVGIPQIRLISEAVRQGLVSKNYVWLVINQIAEPLTMMGGSSIKPSDLNGLFMFDNMLRLRGYPPYEAFLDRWASLDPVEYPFAGQRDITSNEAQAYSCMMVLARGFADAVKGNWTALHLLAAAKLGSKLRPIDMNTNYTGPGGPMVFDEYGDVVYGNFILYNYQRGRSVSIGTSYSGTFNLTSPPMYFDGTFSTPSDSAPLKILNPTYRSPIGIVVASVAGLGIVFSLVTMLIVIIYRNAPVIKASSPLFCCLELVGFILIYCSGIMGLDVPSRFVCISRPILINIGFVLVVGNIVAKNFRVYRIFHNIYVTKRVIRDSHLLKIVGSMMTVNVIILIAWLIKTPPALQLVLLEDFSAFYTCYRRAPDSTVFFSILFVYNVSLLLVATYLAYMNRNVAVNYNECRQIAFVVYNILLSACIATPTIFLPQEQYYTKFFLSHVVLLFGTTVSLLFMFMPKLWKLKSQLMKKYQQQRADEADDSTIDSILQSRHGFISGGGTESSGTASSIYVSGTRKGSIGTLEDSKSDTLRESHMGYMGVRFQHRYFSIFSSWRMRRIVLFPTDKHFTCFELGKPESGRTYSYLAVSIHSREPGCFVLRAIGRGRTDYLLQVKDEDVLLHWYSLFENKVGNSFKTSTRPSSFISMRPAQTRSESEQTLFVTNSGIPSSIGKKAGGVGGKNTNYRDSFYSVDIPISASAGTGGQGLQVHGGGGGSSSFQPHHRHTVSAFTTVSLSPPSTSMAAAVAQLSPDSQQRVGPLDRDPDDSSHHLS